MAEDGKNNELWIMAIPDIKKGDEITVSYGDNNKDFFVDQKCLCYLRNRTFMYCEDKA